MENGLAIGIIFAFSSAAIVLQIMTEKGLTRHIFRFIHCARLREIYMTLALLIVVSTALLMKMIGMSPALGTFLAGAMLANSEFRHEQHSDIEDFKGLLLGIFFITVGAGINFSLLVRNPFLITGQTIGLTIIKASVLSALSHLFTVKGHSRWLFSHSLVQAGKFGFVLMPYAVSTSIIPKLLAERLLLIVALYMLITSLLLLACEALMHRMKDIIPRMKSTDEIDEHVPVIIAGVGRFG